METSLSSSLPQWSSADPVIFIVKKLNEELKTKLTLVDFDEKTPTELLQQLNEVMAEIDESFRGDVRDDEGRVGKMMQLLQRLKFKPPQTQEPFEQLVSRGEKSAIYPILHWLLERLAMHKKRAYVARFMYPVEVPQDYIAQDEALADKYAKYKQLQAEFKRAHQRVERARKEPLRPAEMKTEIATLSDEKKQLELKIGRLAKQNDDTQDFDGLLEATKRLRLGQDEDARLGDLMRKQRLSLQAADQRKRDASARLEKLRISSRGDAKSILEQLETEARALERHCLGELPRDLDDKKERLARVMSKSSDEPKRSREDCEALEARVTDRETKLVALRRRVEAAVKERDDAKLLNLKQHAQLVSRRLLDAEKKMASLDLKLREAREAVERREEAAVTAAAAKGGPTGMSREELKRFGAELRQKTHVYKRLKAEANELRAESVVLHRTEQMLRGRVANLEVFLSELEAKRGVRGYRETQDKLERTAEETSELDAVKEDTLEQISDMVRKITNDLKAKKNDLAPQIKKLRDVRADYQQVETDFLAKKAQYDNIAVGLDVERQRLESECDHYQEQALQEESRFHYLNCLVHMSEATLARLRDEESWTAGQGRGLLPNFKSYQELYTNKLAQQQAFSDQLRKQRAHIEQHEGASTKQRALFSNLEQLFLAKLELSTSVLDDDTGPIAAGSQHHIGGADIYKL